jgi:hypothetical protein
MIHPERMPKSYKKRLALRRSRRKWLEQHSRPTLLGFLSYCRTATGRTAASRFPAQLGVRRGSDQELDRLGVTRFPDWRADDLETGGEVDFKPRPIEGAPVGAQETKPQSLLLDGQQRMTSLYQVALRGKVVDTITPKKEEGSALVLH